MCTSTKKVFFGRCWYTNIHICIPNEFLKIWLVFGNPGLVCVTYLIWSFYRFFCCSCCNPSGALNLPDFLSPGCQYVLINSWCDEWQAAGIPDTDSGTEHGVALEALRQLKSSLEATKLELDDCKLTVNFLGKLNFLLCVQDCSSSTVVFWYKFDKSTEGSEFQTSSSPSPRLSRGPLAQSVSNLLLSSRDTFNFLEASRYS